MRWYNDVTTDDRGKNSRNALAVHIQTSGANNIFRLYTPFRCTIFSSVELAGSYVYFDQVTRNFFSITIVSFPFSNICLFSLKEKLPSKRVNMSFYSVFKRLRRVPRPLR